MCRSRVSGCLLLVTLAACGGRQPSLDDQARQYVRLAVALGERDPDAIDFYAGPADAVADVRRSPPALAALKRDAQRLAEQLGARHDSDPVEQRRVGALVADLAAIAARVDLLTGTRLPFDRESLVFFGIAPAPVDDAHLEAIRARIAAIAGGHGTPLERYTTFASRFVVPPDRLRPVFEAALAACREATRARVTLPAGEEARLELVSDRPWSAFSRFLGGGRSVIQINTDFRFTVDQALQVACHEGYPGHHTRHTLAAAVPWPEHAVQLTFSPESRDDEAAAMLAADVVFSPDERLRVERDRLLPIAGIPVDGAASHIEVERLAGELQIVQTEIARRYLDGELEFARAVRELESRALVPHAESLVKYINEYRSYVTTYTAGRQRLAALLAACIGGDTSVQNRWRCFETVTSSR